MQHSWLHKAFKEGVTVDLMFQLKNGVTFDRFAAHRKPGDMFGTTVLVMSPEDEDSEPLEVFRSAGLRDTFRDALPDATDVQTVHHYRDFVGTRKLDYIMRDERWQVLSAAIIREPARGRLPSDHFPVIAELVPSDPSSWP